MQLFRKFSLVLFVGSSTEPVFVQDVLLCTQAKMRALLVVEKHISVVSLCTRIIFYINNEIGPGHNIKKAYIEV